MVRFSATWGLAHSSAQQCKSHFLSTRCRAPRAKYYPPREVADR